MSFYTPRPLVPLFPPKHVPAKVHLELTRALHAHRRIHVVRPAREVHTRERIREARAIVREEYGSERKRVAQPNGVP